MKGNRAKAASTLKALPFAFKHWRVIYNPLLLRRRGVFVGMRPWISGSVNLALAGDASLEIGDDIFIPRNIEVRGNDSGRIVIGNGVSIDSGARLAVANDAVMEVGDRVGIGPYNIFNAFDHLAIGPETMFGPNVVINCADHGVEPGRPMREQRGTYGPVTIGTDCWLGAMVVVLKGVTIGDGSVVGAGSVVTRDVPPFCIAAGVPAQVVRERS